MLYNEEEVLNICKKYGIETVETEGYPIYMYEEMDENFSIAEIMHEPIKAIHSSDSVKISMSVSKNNLSNCNFYDSATVATIFYERETDSNTNTSTISCNNQNKYAA